MGTSKEAVAVFSSKLGSFKPEFHVVLGSGFGAALNDGPANGGPKDWEKRAEFSFAEIPGLAPSTVPDHHGAFRVYEHLPSGRSVVFQLGRLHGYEGHPARAVVQPVMTARLAGIQNFLLTNAAGGLDPEHRLGDVMLIRDHVNLTGQNPLTGANPTSPDGKELGPRFPDLSALYDGEYREGLRSALKTVDARVHDGVYLGLLGPSFETPAEVSLFSKWGVHAVGMSTVWEAIALRHSGARVAGLSLISNPACGLGDGTPLDHHQIVDACRASARKIVDGILRFLAGARGKKP